MIPRFTPVSAIHGDDGRATTKLRILDMFSGVGGFSLGLERTGGFETIKFCELKPHARAVLAKNFPGVPCHDDVTTYDFKEGEADVITAGFPCQDISYAGVGAGLAGARSGLYREVIRALRVVRPLYAVLENVAALLSRGLDTVLGDLAAVGYDAEWHCIPASAVGAPHRRDRIWIVANARGEQHEGDSAPLSGTLAAELSCAFARNTGASSRHDGETYPQHSDADSFGSYRAAIDINGSPELRDEQIGQLGSLGQDVAYAHAGRQLQPEGFVEDERRWAGNSRREARGQWATEPDVGRVVARISTRLDGGRLDADAPKGGTAEILRAVRDGVQAPELQWPARGFGGLQETEVLLTLLCEYQGKAKPLGHLSLACQEAPSPIVRGVWFDGKSACPSCRRSAQEQRSQEHPDALRILPQLLACDCGSTWLDPTGTPSEDSRVERLTELGNAVVPQIPEMIGRAILDRAP